VVPASARTRSAGTRDGGGSGKAGGAAAARPWRVRLGRARLGRGRLGRGRQGDNGSGVAGAGRERLRQGWGGRRWARRGCCGGCSRVRWRQPRPIQWGGVTGRRRRRRRPNRGWQRWPDAGREEEEEEVVGDFSLAPRTLTKMKGPPVLPTNLHFYRSSEKMRARPSI
jgi:hypothetical protein